MKTNKNEIQHFNFELDKVLDFSRKSAKVGESLEYLQKILRIKKNNKTILDHSLDHPDYDFVTEVKAEVKRLRSVEGKRGKRKDEKINTGMMNVKNLDNLVWWKGTEPQIIYFFELLFHTQLIDKTQYDNRYAIIEANFKNKFGKPFDNQQLARVVINMNNGKSEGKPKKKDAESIENVMREIRETLKSEQI